MKLQLFITILVCLTALAIALIHEHLENVRTAEARAREELQSNR